MEAEEEWKSISRFCYRVVGEYFYHRELGRYFSYGIQLATPDSTYVIRDVSLCIRTAQNIAKRLNEAQLMPIHLEEAIMDMLL